MARTWLRVLICFAQSYLAVAHQNLSTFFLGPLLYPQTYPGPLLVLFGLLALLMLLVLLLALPL